MAREPSEETVRAEQRRPGPDAPDETAHGARPGAMTGDEKRRLAREQGEAIASGRATKGHVVLRTPLRRAVFVGGLVGIVVLALVVGMFG